MLDSNAMVLYFPGPRSVTGEDVLELHVHGGPAIVKAVMHAIPRCSETTGTIRPAEAGDFTRRAFMNDRMDLLQVEAMGDSLAAMTERQRRIAVRGSASELGRQYEAWRQQLLSARGELEALIDFSEDQHFDESPSALVSSVALQVRTLHRAIEMHMANAMRGELLRSGVSISLLGAPNAGKSSLLNRIVGREAAIVNAEAGTTRDVVEVAVDIGGFLVRFGDTAGLRRAIGVSTTNSGTIGAVEQEGIRRAKARAAESDLVIVVLSLEPCTTGFKLVIDPEVADTAATSLSQGRPLLFAVNKTDFLPSGTADAEVRLARQISEAIPGAAAATVRLISCTQTGESGGIAALLSTVTDMCADMTHSLATESGEENDAALGATERQRALLAESAGHLEAFLALADTADRTDPGSDGHGGDAAAGGNDDIERDGQVDVVLAAELLRLAAGSIARLSGRSGEAGDVEEVLGVVFERFCVGK